MQQELRNACYQFCLEPTGGGAAVRTVSATKLKAMAFPIWFSGVQQYPHQKAKEKSDEDGGGT